MVLSIATIWRVSLEEQTCIVEKWLKPPQTIKGVVNEENRYLRLITLPETDIAPKNGCLDATFLSGRPIFTGELLVSGRVCIGLCLGWLWWCCLDFFFQDPGAEVEYFAFHADHIHEPTPRAKLILNDRSPLCWQRFKISKKNSSHFDAFWIFASFPQKSWHFAFCSPSFYEF